MTYALYDKKLGIVYSRWKHLTKEVVYPYIFVTKGGAKSAMTQMLKYSRGPLWIHPDGSHERINLEIVPVKVTYETEKQSNGT